MTGLPGHLPYLWHLW